MDREYFTPNEVAARFKVTRQAVYKWIEQGKLEAVRIEKAVRIPRESIEKLVRPIRPGTRVGDHEEAS